jgi:hypothetical protein
LNLLISLETTPKSGAQLFSTRVAVYQMKQFRAPGRAWAEYYLRSRTFFFALLWDEPLAGVGVLDSVIACAESAKLFPAKCVKERGIHETLVGRLLRMRSKLALGVGIKRTGRCKPE